MSIFNKERFAELIELAQGDKRSLNAYAKQSGISSAHISRLKRGLLDAPPDPNTIKKLSDAAYNDVTYEDLMIAAGHLKIDSLKDLRRRYDQAINNLEDKDKNAESADQTLKEAKAELNRLFELEKPGAEQVTEFIRVPVYGKIAAGTPLFANGDVEEWRYLPKGKYKENEVLILKVAGDSMVGSRIFDGDEVLVKVQPEVENGEIAVVGVDAENATLKRVKRVGKDLWLYPDNPKYNPMLVKETSAKVYGKVVQVMFDPNKH